MHVFLDDEGSPVATGTYYTKEEIDLLQYDIPTCHVEHYTPLTIFCYKEKYTKLQAISAVSTLSGIRHHDNVCEMLTENISDLFTFFERTTGVPYIILIEGIAGIGKTTLCREIRLQWNNKKILKDKKLFLLSMDNPNLKKVVNVESLVKFCQSDISANEARKIVDVLKATDGKYLIIIIDGYSEDSENSFITDCIIGRKILVQCDVVITSRSPASSHLSKIINHRALVLGFTKSNQINFINTALKDSVSSIDHLKNYLCSNTIIGNLCYIPLIMNFLLWCVEEEISKSVKNQSVLVQKYIMTVVKKKNVTSLRSQMIKDLSQFAFTAVKENKFTFTADEILESYAKQVNHWGLDFLDTIYELGLLNLISFETQSVCCELYHFGHVAIQEYLAANHISFLPDSELLELLHSTFWTIHYFNVWIMYVGITGGKNSVFKSFLSGDQPFGGLHMSISNKLDFCLYQLQCLQEADGELDNTLLGENIDLKDQKLLHNHLHTLAILLTKSTNKQWNILNLSGCGIDSHGCTILFEMLCSSTELELKTVDISYNTFHWESFITICSMLKAWHTTKFVFSIDTLYDTVTMNVIDNFKAMLKKDFWNDESSNNVLLLTYAAKQSALIAVYSAPTCIRWTHCKLNEDAIKHIRTFVENEVGNNKFKLAFSYKIIDYHENLPTLLSGIENIQLCGSYLHSKGAYLLNIASTIDCQYNSPQELIADYLAAVLCHNLQSTTPYLKSLSAAYANMVENSLENDLSMSVFDISNNSSNNQIMTEIAVILPFTSNLQKFYASNNNLLAEGAIMNFSTLTVFNISNNYICEKAADDIAVVLSHSTQLQELYLNNNNFKTAGMIAIAKSLQNISTLTVFNIDNNKVDEEAADDIATVLSHNTKLQVVKLNSNSFKTVGMIKIAKALQNISTLTKFCIYNNNVGEEAADDIATVLSHNTKLQVVNLDGNSFKTAGMIKIAKALLNISTLTQFCIYNNNVGEEAADYVATVLSHNTKLQVVNLNSNSFKTVGMIKIAKALQNISTLTVFCIDDNNVGKAAADDIATVLSHNTKLKVVNLNSNSFKTVGMIKIAKALQNISTLTQFCIYNNNVGEEAADYIATVLSHNTKLQVVNLNSNSFKTVGMIKIAKALQNISTLTQFCIYNNNVGEEAADYIATVLSHNTKLQVVNLNSNSFKTVGMIKIAKALQNISTLTEFHIYNNNVGEEAADYVSTVLSHNTQLQVVNLDGNSFKTAGMIRIAKALLNISTLTQFCIYNNNVGEEAADYVATVLSHNTQLQVVNLNSNSFKTVGMIKIAKALQNISTLTAFCIDENNVGKAAADYIATVLSHNTKLQVVNLNSNSFKTVGIIKIAKALQNISTLTEFCIYNNNVGEEAADYIATVLSHNTKLQVVNLNSNSFKTVGMIKIAKALQNISTLTEFCIYNNNVGEEAADYIATVLSHNTKLQVVNLNSNSFKTVGMIKIAKALQNISTLTAFCVDENNVGKAAADYIATVLSHNTKLQVVNLNSNSFKTVGMIKIAKALQNISTLTEFCIYNNNVGEEAADYIATVLSHNTKLQVVNLNSNSFKTVGMIKIAKALQNISTLTAFCIDDNNVGKAAADYIATVLSHNTKLQVVNLNSNSFKTVGMIKIAKALQNISTLTEFHIYNNNVGEEAADDIATVLSHNTQLQVVNLDGNSFKTAGMIKIAKALLNISTLTQFCIYNNNVGEEAADYVATILSHNTQLQVVNLNSNSFKTVGMIKIAKALQNISTLTQFCIYNNNVGEEAADYVSTVLSHNTQLQVVNLDGNSFKTAGMIKIAKALLNISTLTQFCIYNNNVGEEAADYVATILSHNTKLQVVNLDGNSFKTVGMIKIAKALQNISTLTEFCIYNNNVGEEAADDIATVLSHNTKLQVVNLNSNSFKTVGMIKIAKALQNISTMTEFHIYNNNVGEEAADYVSTVLSHNTQLQVVNLDGNSFKTAGLIKIAKALVNISTLTQFCIYNNNIGEEAADYVATVLSHNTQLQVVNLDGNIFKTVGMIKIAKALQNIYTLTEFRIYNNNVGEEAADYIATVLSHNTQLQVVNLNSNSFKTVGMIKIAKALQNVSTLTAFCIDDNNINVGEELVEDIAIILSCNTQLQELHLGNDNINTIDMIKIVKALQNIYTLTKFHINNNNVGEEAADDIATLLSHNTKLQVVNLNSNSFKTVGMIKIAKALQNISTLTAFGIGGNSVGEEAADDIATVLSHNTQLQVVDLDGNSFKTVGMIKIAKALQSISTLRAFCIEHNDISKEAADDIALVLSHNTKLQVINLNSNNFKTEGMIKIAIALQNIYTLIEFRIYNNNVGEEAADDIATVLSHNTQLQVVNLDGNSFKTVGMIKITKALQNISTLTEFCIYNNNAGEEAADYIATVLSHNTELQVINLNSNNFKTEGMIKIAKALQNIFTLTAFGISGNSIGEEAADDIATLLSHNTELQVVNLNSNNFKTEGMIKIAKALQNISTLTAFGISGNSIGEEAADDIATVLLHNTQLQVVDLDGNSFKTVGMIKIAKALQNISTLTAFCINDNNVGEELVEDIATILSCNTQLQELHLGNNNINTIDMIKIVKALQNISSLTKFHIDNNSVGEEAADDIATLLSHNTKLQVVNLNSNNFKTEGMIIIAKALQNISTLTTFGIGGNSIGEEAADDIATALFHNTQLQVVDLDGNSFKTVGMIKIAKALQNISTLTEFCIYNNNVGEEAADYIATVLSHNTKLQVVNLNSNNFKTEGMIKIAKALQNISTLTAFGISGNSIGEEAANDIATVLSHNTQLQVVDLDGNSFKTVGMIKIAKALQNISTLTEFRIYNNNVGEEAADDIVTVLSCNTQLQEVHLHNNNFQTAGAIKITRALQNTSTLVRYDISNNDIAGRAVNVLKDILSWNTKLNPHI